MVSPKQLGLVKTALLREKNLISDVKRPERGELVMEAASESGELGAT